MRLNLSLDDIKNFKDTNALFKEKNPRFDI